ncbi:hypothetical protein DRH13_00030 [Candidatus Woesebacteria bacterium]|nr:MAG: hypothetical protein DRH13_00030 [Candidatus Woesebacteria bacterium]
MTAHLCRGCDVCCNDLIIRHHTYVAKFGKEKEANKKCEALVKIGEGHECSIYCDPTKPTVCRSYVCGWRQAEKLPLALRPDKSRVLFEGKQKEKAGMVLEIRELEEGHLKKEEGNQIIEIVKKAADINKANVYIYQIDKEEGYKFYALKRREENVGNK